MGGVYTLILGPCTGAVDDGGMKVRPIPSDTEDPSAEEDYTWYRGT